MKWLLYIIGFLGLFLTNNALLTMLLFRYDPGTPNSDNLPLLVPSALVGVAMFLCRSSGAILQPLIGYISDRYSSRWGRRRPFLAVAILPVVVSFALLFIPPFSQPNIWNFGYLIVVLCIFNVAIAVYQVPYLAWFSELACSPEQRIKLSTFMAVASLVGSAIGGVGAPWLTQRWGFQGMAIAFCITSFTTLLVPLTVKEGLVLQSSKTISFWKCLHTAWQNLRFRIYMAGLVSAWIAVSILSVCSTFLAVALLHRDVSFGAVVNGIVLLGAISGLPAVNYLVKRWGNGRTLQFAMACVGCGLCAIGILPFLVGTALLPWLILLVFISLGLSSFFTLPNTILAEIIDQDSREFGMRREAIYFGARGLLVETSIGLGFLLAGVLLMLGKASTQPLGVQVAFPVAGFLGLASAWFFSYYRAYEK